MIPAKLVTICCVASLYANIIFGGTNIGRFDQWGGLCLPGERWTEGCTECECSKHGIVQCKDNIRRFCTDDPCLYPSVWYEHGQRCHCTRHNTKICITYNQQSSMNDQQCSMPKDYFYDDCLFCLCTDAMRTSCGPLPCLDIQSVCTPGELHTQACRKCACTENMYQVCRYSRNCKEATATVVKSRGIEQLFPGVLVFKIELPKESGGSVRKPGFCPSHLEYTLPPATKLWCYLALRHNCKQDYDCLGKQKCCLKGCFGTCMDPIDKTELN